MRSSSDTVAAVDLALSGGGFRATLFHLGLIAYLRQQGLLQKVRIICSVSGGSIAAAHLVAHYTDYCGTEAQFQRRVRQLVDGIMTRDISGSVLSASIERLLDLRPLDSGLLAKAYNNLLELGTPAEDRWDKLPSVGRPELYILATHLNTGQPGAYHRAGFHMMPVPDNHKHAAEITAIQALVKTKEIHHLPVSRAVAASSAFPPAFSPVRLLPDDPTHVLTDGGVYDNSGVRYLEFLYGQRFAAGAPDRLVIISDAGRDFPTEMGELYDSIFSLAFRVTDAQGNRIAEFDSQAAISADGTLRRSGAAIIPVSIHDRVDLLDEQPNPLVSHSRLVEARLRRMRTELDRFSREEVFVLFRQGYLLGRQGYAGLYGDGQPAGDVPWTPVDPQERTDQQIDLRHAPVDVLEAAIATSDAFTKGDAIRRVLPRIIASQVWRAYRRRMAVAGVAAAAVVASLWWFGWFSPAPDKVPTGTLAVAHVDIEAAMEPWVWQANSIMRLIPSGHSSHAFISVPIGTLTGNRPHAAAAFAPIAVQGGTVYWFLDTGTVGQPRLVVLAQISDNDTRLRVPPGGPNDRIRGIFVSPQRLADPTGELIKQMVIELEEL